MDIIIIFCSLLLIAYLFDLTAAKTKIPSVMLLLILGWVVRQLVVFFKVAALPNFSPFLPILGTVGLILIVLEGSLELEMDKSKFHLMGKSFLGSIFSILSMSFLVAFLFVYFGHNSLKDSLLNAIPLCIISSAIAIPSVRSLDPANKEFIIYESSLSDIMGVLFFNFIAMDGSIGLHSFGHFSLQLLLIVIVSFVGTIGLSYLLSKIEHHIKFIPIILLIILIYALSHTYHLPALVFILIFGLSIGNLDELKGTRWIKYFKPEDLNREVQKFKELTIEGAFLIRALFFLLFGYLIQLSEILDTHTIIWSVAIVAISFALRVLQLKLSNLPIMPLVFVAPRGLITILLFLSIVPAHAISLVNRSLIIQIILLSSLVMMFGLMATKNKAKE
jgi:Kef-type K+ transport system membrane component KefB